MSPTLARRTAHMIGNAHIDPVWLWQWPEGYQEVRATFRSAIDRLDEYPDFVFTCDTRSSFLDWVEETDPALFARDPRARRRRPLADRRRLVGRARLQHPARASRSSARRCYGQRYLRERSGSRADDRR